MSASTKEPVEDPHAAPSPFSAEIPNLQLVWDSTSLGWLKTCPRLYQYQMLEAWSPRQLAAPLTFGLIMHSALEKYDKARAMGTDHDQATIDALRLVLEETVKRVEIQVCQDPECRAEAPDDAEVCGYCGEQVSPEILIREWYSERPERNRRTLARAIVWYLEYYAQDDMETYVLGDGTPAVELGFKFPAGVEASTGEEFIFSGHLDRIVKAYDGVWIMDRKTTKSTLYSSFFDKFTPDNQMSLYSIGGYTTFKVPVSGVIIDGIQLAVSFNRFQRGFAPRSMDQLEEWHRDAQWWLQQAEEYAKAGYWPMNDESCDKYGGCPFRDICSMAPSNRQQFLESNFQKRPWNPAE